MKKLLFILIAIFSFSGSYAQPDIDWEPIKDAPTITTANAQKIKKYKNTPESLLTYFYASKIRQDKKWQKLLPTDRSKKLNYALEEYEEWTFTKFRLVSKAKSPSGTLWVKIFMEIEYKGRVDSGQDEAALKLEKGKWVIVSLPS